MKRDIQDCLDGTDERQAKRSSLGDSESKYVQPQACSESMLFPSTSQEYANRRLLPWMKANGFSGLEHLEFRYSKECGQSLGCFALKAFHMNDVIFEVPQACIFSLHSLQTSPLTSFITSIITKNAKDIIISNEFLLWLHMIAEKNGNMYRTPRSSTESKESRENLQTYFQSLSNISPSIISWEEGLLRALDGTNVGNSINSLQQKIKDYDNLLQLIHNWDTVEAEKYIPKAIFNYSTLVWAAGHYLSRRYPSSFGDFESNKEKEKELITQSNTRNDELLGNHGALVPLLDILNHKSDQSWIRFEVKDYKLQIICNYPIKQGDEIFSNYGSISNGQLLFAYGYAIEENISDEYLLKLKIPNLPSFRPFISSPSSLVDSTVSQLYAIKRGGISGIPENLLKMLELLDRYQSNPNDLPLTTSNVISFQSANLEKYEMIMPFLMNQLTTMKEQYPTLTRQLNQYGATLEFAFPEESEEGDLIIDSESFESKATLSYDPSVLDYRAQSIAHYLIGQYQIIIHAIQEIDSLFQSLQEDQDQDDDDDEDDDSIEDEFD